MTFQKNKIRNTKYEIQNFREAGITLLLAILVLASILAISFSLATILFIEVRTSGDLLRTEPSLYGAQALTEEAIYKVKRKVPSDQINYSTQIGNVILDSPPPVESSITTPVYQAKVSAATNFYTTANRYALYDATNPDPTAGSQYGRLKLTYLTTGNNDSLAVYVCQFDPNAAPDDYVNPPPCSNPADSTYWLERGYLLDEGESKSWNLNPNLQQELIIFNSGSSGDIYVQIEAFGPSPSFVPKGIPYAGEVSVEVNAEFGGVSRKLRALIPNN